MYDITFTSHSEKYFKKLKEKPLKKMYKLTLEKIQHNPYSGQQKRGDLSKVYSFDMRYQGVNYEIAYLIIEHPQSKIVVILAGTRENFYEQLKRLI
ncbi:type II toxin-antitoxin system RelE/ParE family toxin [Halolactibacillus sp. JCM 19043]|uniref:type II toxin-antitoxin system RelE/ParE family toxin n=1 Tax=Halolactibacillus sp. JCM 19043 TaxID=1460638 RepID=UPI0007859D34|nr:type II toxin-antitoxin system RelE/ParE family toxin [Halolactibacillus sp. JCM 19043]